MSQTSMFDGVKGTPKKKRGRWIALAILALLVLYVVGDGYLFNKIEPQSVVAVYEPGGIRALVNETDKAQRMWKWPKLFGTSIGVTEEPIRLGLKTTSLRFAMYFSDEVTGDPEDKDFVQAYIVDAKIKVKDWQKFFEEINLDEVNDQRRKTSVFPILLKDRFEAIAYPIVGVIRTGEMTDAYGNPLRTKEGYPAMNLSARIAYVEGRLLSDRNIVYCLIDAFGLDTAEEIKEYLKEREPWMHFGGISILEQLADQHRRIKETVQSPIVNGLTWEGGRKRFVYGTDRLELFAKAYKAIQYEEFQMQMKSQLETIAQQRKDFIKQLDNKTLYLQAELLNGGFGSWLKNNGGDLRSVQDLRALSQAYDYFLKQMVLNVTIAFRADEVRALSEEIAKVEEKYTQSPLEETKVEQAEQIVSGVLELIEAEPNTELWMMGLDGLGQMFNFYLAQNKLEELPPETLEYAGLKISTAYRNAVAEKVEEAETFLDDTKLGSLFYQEIKEKLLGQKLGLEQIFKAVEMYLSQEKQELFQTAGFLVNLSWQEEGLAWQETQWQRAAEEELIPFFREFATSDDELAMAIRRVTAEENEALWDAVIEEVLEGEDISKYNSFLTHYPKEGETLAEIAQEYDLGWQALFGPGVRSTAISMVYRSLGLEARPEFNRLVTLAIESGDYSSVYEFAKNVPLKPAQTNWGRIILMDKVEEYSPEWFELEKENRAQRERIIKKYLYKWIEEFAPKVIEEYMPVSPWINYLERFYGVEIVDVNLRIEKDEMLNKSGQPKEEYYELYYSKYGDLWEAEEEEDK